MSDTVEVHTEQNTLLPDKDSISFVAYVGGRKVDCVITSAALAHFRGGGKPISEVFDENRDTIGSVAEFMITSDPGQVDGVLLIRPADIAEHSGAR